MADITAVWTENQALHASSSLAAGATDNDDIDLNASGYDMVDVTVQIIFGGSPDDVVQVDIYKSSDGGVNFDTVPAMTFAVPQVASSTERVTRSIANTPHIRVSVTNQDSTDSVTHQSWFAGRKWNSA